MKSHKFAFFRSCIKFKLSSRCELCCVPTAGRAAAALFLLRHATNSACKLQPPLGLLPSRALHIIAVCRGTADLLLVLADGFPQRVAGLSGVLVSLVACSPLHSLALSIDGELFAWGMSVYVYLCMCKFSDKQDKTACMSVRGSHS